MRVTLFGATGLVGNALMRASTSNPITGLASKDADIRDPGAVAQILAGTRPDWIILAAAYTDVDGCETNPDLAFAVNRDGAINVARGAKKIHARLLFLSTDYVFDGNRTTPYETTDKRTPRTVYGKSKAEAEVRLMEILPGCCIVRTSWVYGTGGKCFPETILKVAATKPELSVVNDQRGTPTYTIDLAHAILELCHKNASGIVHVTNSGECTWYEFAEEIVGAAGLPAQVRPVTSAEFPRPAKRPAYSVLSPVSREKLGINMPDWHDALGRYLEERDR